MPLDPEGRSSLGECVLDGLMEYICRKAQRIKARA